MIRYARALMFGSALLLAFGLLVHGAAVRADAEEDKAIKAAQKDVLDLAKALEDGKDGKDAVARMKKKYDELGTIMYAYKSRAKKGIGIGPEGASIETRLQTFARRAPSATELKSNKEDLVKMGYINAAIADVTMLYVPAKPKDGKGAKEWKQYSTDMKKASLELIDAIKSGVPAQVKKAALNLNNSCNSCHSDFRQ